MYNAVGWPVGLYIWCGCSECGWNLAGGTDGIIKMGTLNSAGTRYSASESAWHMSAL